MPSFLSISNEPRLRAITLMEYEEPQFKLGDIALYAAIDASNKDIQNWTARGFLVPPQNAPRKNKLYSLQNVVQASVIGHLVLYNNPFNVCHSLALSIGNRGGTLIAEGFDFIGAWEANTMSVYYYNVMPDGSDRGVFLTRQDMARVIVGMKTIPGIGGMERRIFESDELIFRVLCNYVEIKK